MKPNGEADRGGTRCQHSFTVTESYECSGKPLKIEWCRFCGAQKTITGTEISEWMMPEVSFRAGWRA